MGNGALPGNYIFFLERALNRACRRLINRACGIHMIIYFHRKA